jgi:hypothetical protein
MQIFHGDSLFFAGGAPGIGAAKVADYKTAMAMEPAAKHHIGWECPGFAREISENNLRGVFGAMPIAREPPQRGRKNEIDILFDDLAERCFRAVPGIFAQQKMCLRHKLLYPI